MKKKVLHIVEAFGGGIFSMLSDLLNKLDDEYEIVVAYSLRNQTPENFKEYFNSNIKFIKVDDFERNINLSKDLRALKSIKNIIEKEKPDIIHLHSSKAGVLGRLAISGKKVKMLYNPHGFSFLKLDEPKIKRLSYWLIEKMMAVINPKCTIVGCSKGEYEEALKLSKNSIQIDNGIDIFKIEKILKGLKDTDVDFNKLKVCTIGRIGYQKDPQMFNEIAEKFPTIEFTWIGDGELKDKLQSNNIKITGWKSRDEVLKILNNNNIFILTSLWEGLPISLLEAMYMKKICIVTNVVGNRDVVEDKKNGFICNITEEFVKVIDDIKNRRYDFEKILQNAYSDVNNKYNTKIMCEKYVREYDRKNK